MSSHLKNTCGFSQLYDTLDDHSSLRVHVWIPASFVHSQEAQHFATTLTVSTFFTAVLVSSTRVPLLVAESHLLTLPAHLLVKGSYSQAIQVHCDDCLAGLEGRFNPILNKVLATFHESPHFRLQLNKQC